MLEQEGIMKTEAKINWILTVCHGKGFITVSLVICMTIPILKKKTESLAGTHDTAKFYYLSSVGTCTGANSAKLLKFYALLLFCNDH